MDTKYTAKDFFLHIAVIVLLYTGTIALLNILFNAINTAFPKVSQYYNYGYYDSNPLSLPVATLIVIFPLLLILTNILRKSYDEDPSRKEYAVRKWLIYITLFIAGGVLAGDLITVLYYFLDGQELTTGFILKVLSVLVVIGAIFGYYIDDLKDRLGGSRRNMWKVIALVLVIGSIVAGFAVIGSPRTQRLLRYDAQKVTDLQNIQWEVVNYWQQKGALPAKIEDIQNSLSGFIIPTDQQTKAPYEYQKTGEASFNLCAVFNKKSQDSPAMPEIYLSPTQQINTNWYHGTGRVCFIRAIDQDIYPPKMR